MTLTASASDTDGSVTRVTYYDGSTAIGSAIASPYSVKWRPSVGSHTLTAVAVDNVGLQTTSAPVTISVIGKK